MDTVDRNYVESLIERATTAALTANEVAELHGLTLTVEQLGFALYFLKLAAAKLPALERNPNGTTDPEHVTDEGIELEPPQG